MEARLREICSEISNLLLNDYVKAIEMKDAQTITDKINKLKTERSDLLKTLYVDNRPDKRYDDIHDFVLEAVDPLLDDNKKPRGYKIECIVSFPSFLYRHCWDTHVKVFTPKGETYYLKVTTTKHVKPETKF